MMGVICREFSRESQLNNNCKILFHSTGVAPEGDIISCINLPENSALIQCFTATLNDAAGDAETAKKMYVDSLPPGTVYVACAKAGFAYKRIIENFFRGLCMWVGGLQKTY